MGMFFTVNKKILFYMKTIFFILTLFFGLLTSCDMKRTNSQKETNSFEFQGLLERQSMTSYQYGTHVISNGGQTYALQSSAVDLNSYVGKKVTIKGNKISGYPLENGPEFIEVTSVNN